MLAVGAPVHALTAAERRRVQMLSALYLVGGPRPVLRPLVDALLGPSIGVEDPEGAAIVSLAFKRAGRLGMYDAIRWLSLARRDLSPVLDRLRTPTLFATGQDDPMWTAPAAMAAAARLRCGTLAILPGAGHIGPLLRRTPATADLITAFWREPEATITAQRSAIAAPPAKHVCLEPISFFRRSGPSPERQGEAVRMDLYSVMCVSDRVKALEWFGVFFGRPADEVIGAEHLWQIGENAWVVVDDQDVRADRVGGAMITLGVTDLDEILARLAAHGIDHEPVETYSNGVRHVVVLDPDGNSLSLAEAPAQ